MIVNKYYTHGGLFHADEVMGFAIFKLANEGYAYARRLTNINQSLDHCCDDGIIADIGRVYEPENGRFDHHQELLGRENGYPYATAGLIWLHFGKRAIENLFQFLKFSEDDLTAIHKRVDEKLIQGLDAHDADSHYSVSADCIAGKVSVKTLSNIVSMFNYEDITNSDMQDIAFAQAADFIFKILKAEIKAAEKYVAHQKAFKEIAVFSHFAIELKTHCEWREIVHTNYSGYNYVIAPSAHPGAPWSLIAVTVEPESRQVKIPIERPNWFKGFIHQGKWIAGGTIEEMRELAEYNVKLTWINKPTFKIDNKPTFKSQDVALMWGDKD